MSKHKTKEQKIISSLHRQLQMQTQKSDPASRNIASSSSTYSYKAKPVSSSQKVTAVHMSNLSHVKHDLIKTTVLMTAIITAQLILYYLLKAHLIIIPIVQY